MLGTGRRFAVELAQRIAERSSRQRERVGKGRRNCAAAIGGSVEHAGGALLIGVEAGIGAELRRKCEKNVGRHIASRLTAKFGLRPVTPLLSR